MKGKEGLQLSRVEEVQFNSSDSDFEVKPGRVKKPQPELWLWLRAVGITFEE